MEGGSLQARHVGRIRPAAYMKCPLRAGTNENYNTRLERVQEREAVLLSAIHCDNAGSNHVAVRNEVRDELLVDGVTIPLRGHRNLRGEEVRCHVAHGKACP